MNELLVKFAITSDQALVILRLCAKGRTPRIIKPLQFYSLIVVKKGYAKIVRESLSITNPRKEHFNANPYLYFRPKLNKTGSKTKTFNRK